MIMVALHRLCRIHLHVRPPDGIDIVVPDGHGHIVVLLIEAGQLAPLQGGEFELGHPAKVFLARGLAVSPDHIYGPFEEDGPHVGPGVGQHSGQVGPDVHRRVVDGYQPLRPVITTQDKQDRVEDPVRQELLLVVDVGQLRARLRCGVLPLHDLAKRLTGRPTIALGPTRQEATHRVVVNVFTDVLKKPRQQVVRGSPHLAPT